MNVLKRQRKQVNSIEKGGGREGYGMGNSLNSLRALHENGYKMEEGRKEANGGREGMRGGGGETKVLLMEEEMEGGRRRMEEAKMWRRRNIGRGKFN